MVIPLHQPNLRMLLIDSTRSGKRIPDSLSKTVPIWCAVINRAILCLYPETTSLSNIEWDVNLYTPPGAVSSQEHHQIEQRLDGWANTLAVGNCLPILGSLLIRCCIEIVLHFAQTSMSAATCMDHTGYIDISYNPINIKRNLQVSPCDLRFGVQTGS